jgi:hypothetical protein
MELSPAMLEKIRALRSLSSRKDKVWEWLTRKISQNDVKLDGSTGIYYLVFAGKLFLGSRTWSNRDALTDIKEQIVKFLMTKHGLFEEPAVGVVEGVPEDYPGPAIRFSWERPQVVNNGTQGGNNGF